jgi:hypothetical protein
VRRYFCASAGVTQFSFLSMCHFYDPGTYDTIAVFFSSLCEINLFAVFSRQKQCHNAFSYTCIANLHANQNADWAWRCVTSWQSILREPCDVPDYRPRDALTFSCQKSSQEITDIQFNDEAPISILESMRWDGYPAYENKEVSNVN